MLTSRFENPILYFKRFSTDLFFSLFYFYLFKLIIRIDFPFNHAKIVHN